MRDEKVKYPGRPSEEFLKRVGIAYLPDNVSILFDEGIGRGGGYGAKNMKPSQYLITAYDDRGEKTLSTNVHAHEYPGRTKHDIFKDLQRTLISQFNAIPAADNDTAPPLWQIFKKAGIPVPLPSYIDATLERRGDMPYMVVSVKGRRDQLIVEMRNTRARTMDHIQREVRQIFQRLGVPVSAPA
jgi:hypothetical protein